VLNIQQVIAPTLRRLLLRYAVVIEKADGNHSSYVPDLPAVCEYVEA